MSASSRLLYLIDAYNDGVSRARRAYRDEYHCQDCGVLCAPYIGHRRPRCDECAAEAERARDRERKRRNK